MVLKRLAAALALTLIAGFCLLGPPARAQDKDEDKDRTRINPNLRRDEVQERPRVNPRVDPRVLPRPDLQLRGPEVRWEADLGKTLDALANRPLAAYRLGAPTVNREVMNRLGQRFGIMGDAVRLEEGLATTSGEAGFLMLEPRSGRLVFNHNFATLIDEKPGDLPSDKEAAEIAQKFLLDQLLLPAKEQGLYVAHVGTIQSVAHNPQTRETTRPMAQAKTVYFGRRVDDIQVVGPGSRAVVQIGDGGEIAGGGVEWRPLGEPIKLSPRELRDAEALQQEIQQTLQREFRTAQRVVVDRIGLFYHDEDGFLQPVVGYNAQVFNGEIQFNYFGEASLMQQAPVQVVPQPITRQMRERLREGPKELKVEPKGSD